MGLAAAYEYLHFSFVLLSSFVHIQATQVKAQPKQYYIVYNRRKKKKKGETGAVDNHT